MSRLLKDIGRVKLLTKGVINFVAFLAEELLQAEKQEMLKRKICLKMLFAFRQLSGNLEKVDECLETS